MRRRPLKLVAPFALTTLATSAVVARSAGVAAADYCGSNEALIFVDNQYIFEWVLGKGTSNEIANTYRGNNTACGNDSTITWSTAHVMLGGIYGNWVEFGWLERRSGAGYFYLKKFVEWGLNFNTIGTLYPAEPSGCTNRPSGGYSHYKVYNSGSEIWTESYDCEDGSGFRDVAFVAHTTYGNGYSAGETGKWAGSSPSMADTQKGLLYLNSSSGNWTSWANNLCFFDNASGWQNYQDSATQYHILPGSSNCT